MKERGRQGEDIIAKLLENQGFEIVTQNYYSRYGEIDIIAKNGVYILFVEVKARNENGLGTPAQAVTKSKQRKIALTASKYLQENPIDLQPRFDVAEVFFSETGAVKTEYIENAFWVNNY